MRETSMVVATTCAAVLLGFTTVATQGSSKPAHPSPAPIGVASKPFERLFTPQSDVLVRSQLLMAREKLKDIESGSTRRFICGMPVLQADPAVDPTSIVPPPATRTRFEIQTVQPSCR